MRRDLTRSMILGICLSSPSITSGQDAAPRAPNPPAAQPAKPIDPVSEAKAREEMDLLLAEWERRSATIASLQVVFERIDRSLKWGDQVYQGQAILKSPDLACLEFKEAIADDSGKPVYKTNDKGQKVLDVEKEPFQRLVWTDKEVFQYQFNEKAIYAYPLVKGSRPKSLRQFFTPPAFDMPVLLKPFLFGMKADEAKKHYEFSLVQQTDDEYMIAIVAREKLERQHFDRAFIRLNKSSLLPSRLILIPVGGEEKQEFRFTAITANQPVPEGYFRPSTDLAGWRVNRIN